MRKYNGPNVPMNVDHVWPARLSDEEWENWYGACIEEIT